jgi:hypothetical protein
MARNHGKTKEEAVALAARLRTTRPVYVDTGAMPALLQVLGYVPDGLVGEVVNGTGTFAPKSTAEVEARLDRRYQDDGIFDPRTYNRFPNSLLFLAYENAQLELATSFYGQGKLDKAEERLRTALRINPGDTTTRTNLQKVIAQRAGRGPKALP